MIFSKHPKMKFNVDSAVVDIINDFNRIAFSNGFYPILISVIHDSKCEYTFNAHFQLRGIPNYETLRLLNQRFSEVIIKVYHEADVHIEVLDNIMPFNNG